MTEALCFRCGSIKFGAWCGCPECGTKSSGDHMLDIAFSDHQMSRATLEKFGEFIKLLRSRCEKEEVCFWAFIRFISDKHPSILRADVPEPLIAEIELLLAQVEHPQIQIEPGIDEQFEKQEAEKRAQKQRMRSERGVRQGSFFSRLFRRGR